METSSSSLSSESSEPSPKRRVRQRLDDNDKGAQDGVSRPRNGQVFLRFMELEGFKTFRDRERIDFCPGWEPNDAAWPDRHEGKADISPAAPFTVVFGGNGAGKSAVFDAILFVLGQRSKSVRSTNLSKLINDETVRRQGDKATAAVIITFQKKKHSPDDNKERNYADIYCLSVGRSVKRGTGASTFTAQGVPCSRQEMLKTLNDFVEADMGDVDRYVLKQGSTMVCRREGRDLLAFIERLAGTASLKTLVEEAQATVDNLREECFNLELQIAETNQNRRYLQPQVDALFVQQKVAGELHDELIMLWHRQLAFLRIRSEKMNVELDDTKRRLSELKDKMTHAKVRDSSAESTLSHAREEVEHGLKAQTTARGTLQKAKAAQAEADARARKSLERSKAKSRALVRAHQLLEEGDAEVANLSKQAVALDEECNRIQSLIGELEVENVRTGPGSETLGKHEALVRELRSIDDGPMAELEKAVREHEVLRVKASANLKNLENDAVNARREEEEMGTAAKMSKESMRAVQRRLEEIESDTRRVRANCTSQQAHVSSLTDRRRRASATPRNTADTLGHESQPNTLRHSSDEQNQMVRRKQFLGPVRPVLEKLRGEGVGVHGILADLVLLRHRRDEDAVNAALGSVLRKTIVVQTRMDGARVVAAIKAAGIRGSIRCDILGELTSISATHGNACGGSVAKGATARTGIVPLSECVTVADPLHLPAVETHLRGWLLAESREAAWNVTTHGATRFSKTNVVTTSGELYYAGGEVAVKSPLLRHYQDVPRLGVLPNRNDHGELARSVPAWRSPHPEKAVGHKDGEEEDGRQLGRLLQEAQASVQLMEERMAVLAREGALARFDLEDAAARHSAAQIQAGECREEVARLTRQLDAQRGLFLASGLQNIGGDNFRGDCDDAVALAKLRMRRDAIVDELRKSGWAKCTRQEDGNGESRRLSDDSRSQGDARRDLQSLKDDADTKSTERNEVRMKLRVLMKRSKGRKERVSTLDAETKGFTSHRKAIKVRQANETEMISTLAEALEDATTSYRAKRELLREAEGAARQARRELNLVRIKRMALLASCDSLRTIHDKTEAESLQIARSLRKAGGNIQTPSTGRLPACADYGKSDGNSEVGNRLALGLAAALRGFIREGSEENSTHISACSSEETFSTCSSTVDALPEGNNAASGGTAHESEIVKLMYELLEDGRENEFIKKTRTMEASIRLKQAAVDKLRQAVDVASISCAVRLENEAMEQEDQLERVQESVVVSMDQKEALEATRHATLIECLEEINEALGSIFRRLTSIEETSFTLTSSNKVKEAFGAQGVPGGDCFLRFSRERSLLLGEGLAVEAKLDASSPWRGPGQLSGGQVALVGLALNLATQAVRPAPLYLMDEIDSALDTHKVRRVAAVLAGRARGGNEQCIVISHRPEMHEQGSHLLGVYHCQGTARTVNLQLQRHPRHDHQQHYDQSNDIVRV